MALTAQLDVIAGDGTIAGIMAIDPSLWASNASTLNAHAASRGVSLIYYDNYSPGEVEVNAPTLADAEAQIAHFANVAAYATGPTTTTPASSGATLGDGGSSGAGPILALAGLALTVVIAIAGSE